MYVEVVLNNPLDRRFTYAVPEGLMCDIGMRVQVPFGAREVTAYVVDTHQTVEDVPFVIKDVKRVIDTQPLYGRQEIALAVWMSRWYVCSEGEALSCMIPGGRRDVDPPVMPIDEQELAIADEHLSLEQQQAIDEISQSTQPLHYVYGVTGSGKSEVFLRVAEHVIASGRQVIYLVPEITLTHQLAQQVSKRFENQVAILHSGMTPSQRIAIWRRIRRDEIQMVIGARSAVFAPFTRLGLIIIDEEHENSYKSGNVPRYHARQVAQKRVLDVQALLVMGSATPSLEAWHMIQEGHVIQHYLPNRVAGGRPPEISVVNMLAEQRLLSRALREAIQKTLNHGRQTILFLNRRGFSHFFHCNACGYEMSCPHCSVSLTYHKSAHRMMCHYCGYSQMPVSVCPSCASVDVGYGTFGTEMVESEVKQLFPQARIARLDTDTARKKDTVASVLSDFRAGKTDILLGTQMVAKGLNFPLVDLVGIVLADSALNLPDFRAQERTFSLIIQVSGRTGRYNDAGRVIVQTYHPENSAIALACQGNLAAFYQQELEMRKSAGFPPYRRMVNFVIRGKQKIRTVNEMERLRSIVEQLLEQLAPTVSSDDLPDIMGSAPCPLERIAGNWRHHLVLRGRNAARVLQITTAVRMQYTPPSGVYLEIDIDPLQML
jgi:primosomal protein N' (replication factor Y)